MPWKAFAKVFFRLGCLGFGGPGAVMSMIEEECSRKRNWISSERFSHLLTICKVFPGPVATQMVIALGRIQLGLAGGLLAGMLFILPAFLLVLGLSVWYRSSGVSVGHGGLLWAGLQMGAVAVIGASVLQLAKPYRHRRPAWMIGFLSAGVVAFRPQWEPLLIVGFGLAFWLAFRVRRSPWRLSAWGAFLLDEELRMRALQIFWICFKAGAFVFGTGLAVVPVLEGDFVQRLHWVTHAQFMDGLAIGQVTPGPVTITATFLGFQVMGWSGAFVATAGIFLAAFLNGLFVIPRIWGHLGSRGAEGASAFSSGAVPAVVGGVLGTGLRLGWQTLEAHAAGAPLLAVVGVVAVLGLLWRHAPAWLVIPGAGVLAFLGEHLGKIIWPQ